ncbi:MAG: hypothetical protein ABIK20_05735 [Candidatus Omnitrophota bacterium]
MINKLFLKLRKEDRLRLIVQRLPVFLKRFIRFTLDKKFRKYNSLFGLPECYVKWIAPNLSFYVYWLAWPLYFLLMKKRVSFLVNIISHSVGHVSAELDWFFRRLYLGEIESGRRYVVVWPQSEVAYGAVKIFGKRFYKFISNDILYMFLLPLTMKYTALRLDCSLSAVDNYSVRIKNYGMKILPIFKLGYRPFEEVLGRWVDYFAAREKTNEVNPLKILKSISPALKKFLGKASKKYAVIQIKDVAGNGTAIPTDPVSYLTTIKYLLEEGCSVVFAGREKMPKSFSALGVINYAESEIACFQYDCELIQNAEFVLSSASGFSMVADTCDVPLVCAGQWAPAYLPPGRFTVNVPTLFIDNNKNFRPLVKQVNFFYECRNSNSSILSSLSITTRAPSQIEILEATKEALRLKHDFKPRTGLQIKFQELGNSSTLAVSQSRVSQYFIEKYELLL